MITIALTSAFWIAVYFLYTRPSLRAKVEAEAKVAYDSIAKKL